MSRLLPIRPDLEHLRNEAKTLLKAQKKGDPSICPLLRKFKRFEAAADADVRKEIFATPAGREALASLLDEIAGLEATAVRDLQAAAEAMT